MKKLLIAFLIMSAFKFVAQNKQVFYNFAELPQTLLLNPAAETNYKFHIGIPLISGFSTEVGSTGVVLTDIFAVDNVAINDKIASVLNKLTTRDFLKINTQIEVISGGFRMDDKTYISFGFYHEIDAIGYYPKDVFTFASEGNTPYIHKNFMISQLRYQLDFSGVLHAGISRKIDENLTLGGRFKIYSSALNAASNNNTGTFTTVQSSANGYDHHFNNVNVQTNSSGIIINDELEERPAEYLKNTFFGGNLGVGIDVGITYNFSQQLQFSASILDVGFVNHKKNIRNNTVQGDFVFEGINFLFDAENPTDYWGELDERFKEELPIQENEASYISWKPAKINAALKYNFGDRRSKICYDDTYKDFYTDAIGFQLYSVFRPLRPQLALTAFYQKSITTKIHTKFTYTIDDFSNANIGAGLSAQFGKVNLYGMLGNILAYKNLSSANSLSLQLGVNLIFN